MTSKINPQDALDFGVEAYVYLYPLVTMDVTRRLMTNVPPDKMPGFGPANSFHHMRVFPDADFKAVVRPNFDTLYSSAWLDLTREPLILTVPDTQGRYYLLPMLDMYTDVFASPGARTSGTAAGTFAIVPAGWSGQFPAGVQRIDAPTPYVWIIGRTQTNGPADYEFVHGIQNGYQLTPLSRWPNPAEGAEFKPDPTVDMKTPPLDQVNNMPAKDYFTYGVELMRLHPPHVTDWSQIARRKLLGITPGQKFGWDKLDPVVQDALSQAPAAALQSMKAKTPTMAKIVNGWQMNTDSMGVYGDYYLKRAIVAMVGLGANQAVDAIYPLSLVDADGKAYTGSSRYVLHFGKDELPPVAAFWSITMYDDAGFQCANEINRFAIGDRDALKYNPDGSLDLYFQHENPGSDKTANWLPAPSGSFNLTMRLYAPRPQVLDGRWIPPAVKRIA
jgi:hypothetical protein